MSLIILSATDEFDQFNNDAVNYPPLSGSGGVGALPRSREAHRRLRTHVNPGSHGVCGFGFSR